MKDLSTINKLFTQNNFSDLIKQSSNNKIYDFIINDIIKINDKDKINNKTAINNIYNFMSTKYRNEYFYQNTLFNKLLLGRHSLNTTTAIFQLPINKSKADYIMINGQAVVFEIKTELDSFDRLKTQLNDYQKAFNNVCVVTCEQNYQKLENLLEYSPIGIYVLSDKNTLQYRKKFVEYNDSLDYKTIFNILRKSEYEDIILDYYKYLPKTTQVRYYDACFELISKIPIELFYKKYISKLKLRNRVNPEQFKEIPYELKSLYYFSDKKKLNYDDLTIFLEKNIWR